MTLTRPTYDQLVQFLIEIDEARFNDPNPSYVNGVFNNHSQIVGWLWYEFPKEHRSNFEPMLGTLDRPSGE